MARENFSIGVLYNITKNQHNPIKTVGQDSFLSPKTPKNTSFLGVTQPPGVAQPLYSRGHNQTQTYNVFPSLIEIGSKTPEKNSAQTNRQTDRHYANNGHLAVNQKAVLNSSRHHAVPWLLTLPTYLHQDGSYQMYRYVNFFSSYIQRFMLMSVTF